jgi:hypothetical protein
MIVFIQGRMGTGKTLALTFFGWLAQQNRMDVYSMYKVNYPHTPVYAPAEVADIRRGVFLGDELWSWIDARSSGKKDNKVVTSMLMKSRKMGYDIYHTAQHYMQVDIRIRKHTDYMVYPQLSKDHTQLRLRICSWEGENNSEPILRFIADKTIKTAWLFKMYDSYAPIYGDELATETEQPIAEQADQWVTMKDACDLTGRRESVIRLWIREGIVTTQLVDGKTRLFAEDLKTALVKLKQDAIDDPLG